MSGKQVKILYEPVAVRCRNPCSYPKPQFGETAIGKPRRLNMEH